MEEKALGGKRITRLTAKVFGSVLGLWLNGMTGTRKSTITCIITHTFHNQRKLKASFFFFKDADNIDHVNSFVSILTHQLADTSFLLKQYICEATVKHLNIAQQDLCTQ